MISFDFTKYMDRFVSNEDKLNYEEEKIEIKRRLTSGDLSQWTNINTYIGPEELAKLFSVADYARKNCDVFVVIGIGGSYMGSKAIIEALMPMFNRKTPEIIFLGTNLSSDEYFEILEYIKDKEIVVNVISKSGTTLEPSIAFDQVIELMEAKYDDEELEKRIIATTDPNTGYLRSQVNEYNYTSFNVPENVGGRFSVLTPVGLLPLAVAGIDISKLLDGAKIGVDKLDESIEYSIIRDILYNNEKLVESFTVYNGKLYYFTEWLKQLFGETQGKDGMGLLPISCVNSRDLHSLGQYFQDGEDIIFETVIGINKGKHIYLEDYDLDLNAINSIALEKVAEAHYNGETPSIIIRIEDNDEYHLGIMIQFFIQSAIVGALLLEVNPFDQPGVQEYKKLIEEGLELE